LARWIVKDASDTELTVTPDATDPNKAWFRMPANGVSVHAEFQVIKYNVTFEIVGIGTADTQVINKGLCTAKADPTTAELARTVTITAYPDWRYEFHGWEVISGGVTLVDASLEQTTFQMSRSDVHIRAKFDHKLFNITVTDDGHGTISSDVPKSKAGGFVTLTARPTIDETNDYMFDSWTDVKSNTTGVETLSTTHTETQGRFRMPEGDAEVKVNFRVRDYSIEVITDGKGEAWGSTSRSIATNTIRIEATVPEGYTFFGWTVTEGEGATIPRTNPAEFTMPRSDLTIRADFAYIPVEPYILFIDYNGRLAAGQWIGDGTGAVGQGTVTRDNLLYFKYSSLMGMTSSAPNGTEWKDALPSTRFFNPSKEPISSLNYNSGSNGVVTIKSGYGRLPGYDWNIEREQKIGDIATDAFNNEYMTLERVMGDACRLLNLNEDEAYEMLKAGTLSKRNSGFRMPSNDRYGMDYLDKYTNVARTYTTPDNRTEWVTVGGITGRWLTDKPDASTFMPAAGNRSYFGYTATRAGGKIEGVGDYGAYASSDNMSGPEAYLFELFSADQVLIGRLVPDTATYTGGVAGCNRWAKTSAYPIRCVRK
jgi:uncharacterized repeat protein (TIGR02543 family)